MSVPATHAIRQIRPYREPLDPLYLVVRDLSTPRCSGDQGVRPSLRRRRVVLECGGLRAYPPPATAAASHLPRRRPVDRTSRRSVALGSAHIQGKPPPRAPKPSGEGPQSETRCRPVVTPRTAPHDRWRQSLRQGPLDVFLTFGTGPSPEGTIQMYPDEHLDHEIVLMIVATVCLLAIAGVRPQVQLAIVALFAPRLLKRREPF